MRSVLKCTVKVGNSTRSLSNDQLRSGWLAEGALEADLCLLLKLQSSLTVRKSVIFVAIAQFLPVTRMTMSLFWLYSLLHLLLYFCCNYCTTVRFL